MGTILLGFTAIIFFLCYAPLPITGSCTKSGGKYQCHLSAIMNNFPGHPSKYTTVDYSAGSIVALPNRGFWKFSKAKNLYLRSNRIFRMEKNAFYGLKSLELLDLSRNQLISIKKTYFTGLSKLSSLELSRNRIQTIEDGAFQELKNLQTLKLGNNYLMKTTSNTFSGLSNLKILYLNGNKIKGMGETPFRHTPKLQRLNLAWNKLTEIDKTLFRGLHKLSRLSLYRNKIEDISDMAFDDLDSLKSLSLQRQDIKAAFHVTLRMFEKFARLPTQNQVEIRFNDNKMKCYCDLKWYAILIRDKTLPNGKTFYFVKETIFPLLLQCENKMGFMFAIRKLKIIETCKEPKFADWGSWSTCTKSCETGEQVRTRQCVLTKGYKRCVGESTQKQKCNTQSCAVDGAWSSWTSWSECSTSCGGGQRNRKRGCDNPRPQGEGKMCSGETTELQTCNKNACPIHGKWTVWSEWSYCSKTCGEGTVTKERSCSNPAPENGGKPCKGKKMDRKRCYLKLCIKMVSKTSDPLALPLFQPMRKRYHTAVVVIFSVAFAFTCAVQVMYGILIYQRLKLKDGSKSSESIVHDLETPKKGSKTDVEVEKKEIPSDGKASSHSCEKIEGDKGNTESANEAKQ